MKILFATKNPAKVERYAEELKKHGFEILTIKDLNQEIKIEEKGKNSIENAIEKAKKYYELTKLTTIGIDDSMFIEGLPEEKQPGTNIRRVNGKRLTDKEAIDYYINLTNELGGKAKGYYLHGYAICKMGKIYTYQSESHFTFVNKKSDIIKEGYPLDSIAICPIFNKYQSELTEEEKNYKRQLRDKDVFEFFLENIK